jgi:NTE family protein
MSVAELMDTMLAPRAEIEDSAELRCRVGALALTADTVPETARLAVIEVRLPVHAWLERALSLVAVDAHTGQSRTFTRDCGVGLVEAVAASCAAPGVWPPVACATSTAVSSSTSNVHLAVGYPVVLVFAPLVDSWLDSQVTELTQNSSQVEVIVPDENSLTAFGLTPLDPDTRTPAARAGRAGRAQGHQAAITIAELWK